MKRVTTPRKAPWTSPEESGQPQSLSVTSPTSSVGMQNVFRGLSQKTWRMPGLVTEKSHVDHQAAGYYGTILHTSNLSSHQPPFSKQISWDPGTDSDSCQSAGCCLVTCGPTCILKTGPAALWDEGQAKCTSVLLGYIVLREAAGVYRAILEAKFIERER